MAAVPTDVNVWTADPMTNALSATSTERIYASFTDPVSKALVTPDAVVWQYNTATTLGGAPTPVTPVNDSVGLYHYDLAFAGVAGKFVTQVQAQSSGAILGGAQLMLVAYSEGA